jgi:hypothetical protein
MTDASPSRLALVGALVPLAGCPDPEPPDCSGEIAAAELPDPPTPSADFPTLVETRWLSADTLELQFSEPLATPSEPLAPHRFRVMGWNLTTNIYTYYGGSNDDCTLYTQYFPMRQGGNFPADLWQAPEDASVLRLRMNAPVTCTTQSGRRSGLALFYTNDPFANQVAPAFEDLDGNMVADIGPSWAITALGDCSESYANGGSQGYYYYYGPNCSQLVRNATGSFPLLDELAEIPCPS